MRDDVTAMILTFNEINNIQRTLAKLEWMTRILIVDSGSDDGTIEMVTALPQVEVIRRSFDTFANQCNFGLMHVRTRWVLSLDADYELSDALVSELQALDETDADIAYAASFVYRVYGRPLRGTLYPSRTILYRVQGANYADEGHGHRVRAPGTVRRLHGVVYHDDRKPLSRWLATQPRYAEREAAYLLGTDPRELLPADRLRRMIWPAPLAVVLYVLLAKGCLLDGWPGWFYALQRLLAETMIALALIDRRLRGDANAPR